MIFPWFLGHVPGNPIIFHMLSASPSAGRARRGWNRSIVGFRGGRNLIFFIWKIWASLSQKMSIMGVIIAGWWFGTFFTFPYVGNSHPNWLIFFRGVQTTNLIGILLGDILFHRSLKVLLESFSSRIKSFWGLFHLVFTFGRGFPESMGVPQNWMVYRGKSHLWMMTGDVFYFRKHHNQ